jgi:ADP-ribose pyrophosphatase
MTDDPSRIALPDIRIACSEAVDDSSPGFMAFDRRRLRVCYPDGSLSEPFLYDAVTRRLLDAVVVAAHYERDGQVRVYLRSAIRPAITYRDPARSAVAEAGQASLWELPAGLVEPGEETSMEGVMRAAQRELHEEVGFEVELSRLEPLGPSTFPAPGFIAERHYYFATRVDPPQRVEPPLDGSPLEKDGMVIDVTLEAALKMCQKGEIEDAKTELGLRRLQDLLR